MQYVAFVATDVDERRRLVLEGQRHRIVVVATGDGSVHTELPTRCAPLRTEGDVEGVIARSATRTNTSPALVRFLHDMVGKVVAGNMRQVTNCTKRLVTKGAVVNTSQGSYH